jgi:hypothetical protein
LGDFHFKVLELALNGVGASNGSPFFLNENGDVRDTVTTYDGQIKFNEWYDLSDVAEPGLAAWIIENRQAALVFSMVDQFSGVNLPARVKGCSGDQGIQSFSQIFKDLKRI